MRRPAARREKRKAGQRRSVALRISIAKVEVGDEHARVGRGHAWRQAKTGSFGRDSAENDPLPDALRGHERASDNSAYRRLRASLFMAELQRRSRLAAPPEHSHRRALVGRHRVDFRLPCLAARPACAWAPATATWAGAIFDPRAFGGKAGVLSQPRTQFDQLLPLLGILRDSRGRQPGSVGRGFRLRRGPAPAQPFDAERGQVKRGDPLHPFPP